MPWNLAPHGLRDICDLFALNHERFRAVALNPAWFRAAMYPILNYVEFRTNHEPYMVHGVVHGGVRLPQSGSSASWVGATSVALISVFNLLKPPNSELIQMH